MASTSIVVEGEAPAEAEASTSPRAGLVSWVMDYVERNRKARDNAYKQDWDEYYRIWRGKWSPESRTRQSERSRLISPATAMAVDLTVAELVEATLGQEHWFDIPDDVADQQKEDVEQARTQLVEDLYRDGIVRTLIDVLQNGALYGEFIAKIVTEVRKEPKALRVQTEEGQSKLVKSYEERVAVFPVAIEPSQFVWDTSGAIDTDTMIGVAHEFPMPLHRVRQRQADGVYDDSVEVGPANSTQLTNDRDPKDPINSSSTNQDRVLITEWHGLVPKKFLVRIRGGESDPLVTQLAQDIDEFDLTEAIVTIANEGTLLRAIPNPSVMDDRAVVAEQFDTVTSRFIGRGVVEKAYNSQKGLDTELRARADALAWVNNPMMAGDVSRMPPKQDLNVWPGKFWATRGNPGEIMQEFRFGDVNMSTFQQSQEYERMVAQATGATDPGTLRSGVRDETAMGAGVAASGMVKRSKRTMFHFEVFLNKLLRRIMWRKMQFEPTRYPNDFEFQVKGAIGIIAREVEIQHLVNMLAFVDEGSPAKLVILKAIFELSSSTHKAELSGVIDKLMQPDPEQQKIQQQMQALALAEQQAKVSKLQAETAKIMADAKVKGADEMLKKVQARVEIDEQRVDRIRAMIEAQGVAVQVKQTQQEDRSLQLQSRQLDLQERELSAKASKGE